MRTMLKFVLVIVFMGINSASASANYQQILKKRALFLTGKHPEFLTREKLATVPESQKMTFIETQTNSYLDSDAFISFFKNKMDGLFRLQGKSERFGGLEAPFDYLASELLKNNESWDNLLLKKSYTLMHRGRAPDEAAVYQFIFPDEIEPLLASDQGIGGSFPYPGGIENQGEKVELIPKNQNQMDSLAGALTTARFFRRYTTTKLNKNRRRAAAIFRIFLCDNMKPAVVADNKEDTLLLRRALGESSSMTIVMVTTSNANPVTVS